MNSHVEVAVNMEVLRPYHMCAGLTSANTICNTELSAVRGLGITFPYDLWLMKRKMSASQSKQIPGHSVLLP